MADPRARELTLTAADGHSFAVYRADPAGTPRGAIVVVQEIFGVNAHIRRVTDGFAADGYVAIAPAMFDRVERGVNLEYTRGDISKGRALKTRITTEMMTRDVEAAIAEVAGAGKVGIVGYCWGGFVAWMCSATASGLSCAVPYYGGGMTEAMDIEPRVPVMMHMSDRDTGLPVDKVRALAAKHPQAQLFLYEAEHGFNCDMRGSYNEAAATLARQRTLDFFHTHVG
jgi:carboxymethylenebutenolidase